MPIEIKFSVYVDEERCLDEDTVLADLDQYGSGLVEDRRVGTVFIYFQEAPDDCIEIEDELEYLVDELCFRHITDLIAHHCVMIEFWSYPGHIQLDAKEVYTHISGDYIPNIKAALSAELLPALYNCGKRYIQLLKRLVRDKADYENIARLETHAKVARQALEDARMI
jgi:hypothetical protein